MLLLQQLPVLLSTIVAVLIAANASHAQITYIDSFDSNTTVNGSPMVIQNQNTSGSYVSGVHFNVGDDDFTGSATDWLQRDPFANSGNAFQQPGTPGADVLNTIVSGLPSNTYRVFAYYWDATPIAADWDLAARLNAGAYIDKAGSSVGVVKASELTFSAPILTSEGNREMYAIDLGTFTGTSFTVDAKGGAAGVVGGSVTDVRTWYDGVGYTITDPTANPFNAISNTGGDQPAGLGTNYTSSTPLFVVQQGGNDDPKDAFGNNNGPIESTSFIFANGGVVDNGNATLGDGGEAVDFIQWQTTSPIALAGFRLHASGDGGGPSRGTELVQFNVEGSPVDLFDNDAGGSPVDRLFSGGAVAGDEFKIELTRTTTAGPRIFEIDAILAEATTYDLEAATSDTSVIVGGTTTVGSAITNTGIEAADRLSFTGLDLLPSAGGSVDGSDTSGGPLLNNGGSSTNGGRTFTGLTPGIATLTPTVTTATNNAISAASGLSSSATLGTATGVNITVLDHSNAVFANVVAGDASSSVLSDNDHTLTIDFGTVAQGAGGGNLDSFFDIFADVTTPSFTAMLDLDSISAGTGDTSTLFLEDGLLTASNVAASTTLDTYTYRFDTSTIGSFSAQYLFNLSDENLPGATSQTITLNLLGNVAAVPEPGSLAIFSLLGLLTMLGLAWRRRRGRWVSGESTSS